MDKDIIAQPQPGLVPAATSIEALIARAIDKGVPVETMERLLVMRTQLKQEAARESFIAALADFQATCPAVPRTRTAKIESPRGSYTYHYAALEDIVKAIGASLAQHGLTYSFDVALTDNPPRQVVCCTIRHTDGHSESSTFTIPVDASGRMNVAQQHASAQTYAKRYALSNALGIVTADDDDDAHSSSPPAWDKVHQNRPPTADKLKVIPNPPPHGKPISDAQRKRLYAIYKQAGHHDEDVRQWLGATYAVQHSNEITTDMYDAICNRLADRTPLNEPEPPPPDMGDANEEGFPDWARR